MTPEELEAIRERDRFFDTVTEGQLTGDRRALLAEVDRLRAQVAATETAAREVYQAGWDDLFYGTGYDMRGAMLKFRAALASGDPA